MKHIFVMCAALLLSATMMAKEKIVLNDVATGVFAAKGIGGIVPLADSRYYAQLSNDGKCIVSYAFATNKKGDVLFDVKTARGQKLEKIDGFIPSPDGKRFLIQTQTHYIYRRSFTAQYYIYTVDSKKLEPLSVNGSQQAPLWSPDGLQVAFVRDNNIFLVKLLYDNAELQVTKDGEKNKIINGIPDWVYEEEFTTSNSMAFNADGTMLCWLKYDESKVKTFGLTQYKGLKPEKKEYTTYPGVFTYKYPKAGEDNSIVTVWSYDIASRQVRQLNVPTTKDSYIPRLHTTKDADKMLVCTLNRHQNDLKIYLVNPRSAVATLLLNEKNDKYIKEDVYNHLLIGKQTLVLPSDRSGYMQLYIYGMDGTQQRVVSTNQYDITQVYGYDESTGDVYYQAAVDNAHERQILVTNKNGKTSNLTNKAGWNDATFSPDYKYFINKWSDMNTPAVITLCNRQGKTIATINDNKELVKKLSSYELGTKEMFSFTTSEGVKLDGWMVKPAQFDTNKKYPVIMFQYSGPGSQQVVNSYDMGSMGQGSMYDHYLAQQGFIVVCVDGRGTGGRGAEFEKCTYLSIGKLESKDQVETAIYLSTLPFVDKDRIGIWGWSYGGFNTLMSMSEGRPVFKSGVAVAAPTSFRFYDSVYTERYMRTPNENASGYDDNPISRVNQLHGDLLLCHGTADDNVHPQNAYEYAEALVQADKDFKEVYYTNRNHSIRGGNTRNHLLRQIARFFEQTLNP